MIVFLFLVCIAESIFGAVRFLLWLDTRKETMIIGAHNSLFRNKICLTKNQLCGCFFCLKVFYSREITEYVHTYETALCPYCRIDSVIGENSGYPIDDIKFLKAMHKYWFGVRSK